MTITEIGVSGNESIALWNYSFSFICFSSCGLTCAYKLGNVVCCHVVMKILTFRFLFSRFYAWHGNLLEFASSFVFRSGPKNRAES